MSEPAPPFTGAHFRVLIGETEVGFCHVSRLHVADGQAAPKEADAVRPRASVVLRRALSQDKALYRWRQRTAAGKEDPQVITVHQCEAGGERILNTWLLHGCRPMRWSGPEFNALSGDVLWEEIEVSWERLEWR
jgi:phage tail-like protein